MNKTREQNNKAARQTYRMPKLLDVLYRENGRDSVGVEDKLIQPIHCCHRMLTGGEIAEAEGSMEMVVKGTMIGKMLSKNHLWFFLKCTNPGKQQYSLSTINLVRADDDGALRLVLAATTMSRITNYIQTQPQWALCPPIAVV